MASSPITSWQIDGDKVETVTDFISSGSQTTVDGDCNHEIKGRLLLGGKAMTNLAQFSSVAQSCPTLCDPMNRSVGEDKLDTILKSRDTTLPTKVHVVKAMIFPVVIYECESWTIKKAEHQRIAAFKFWSWRRLLTVPWTARRSNQSILKEIKPKYSLEGLMLKLRLQYFGHLMQRVDSLEKTLMLGKIEGRRRKG